MIEIVRYAPDQQSRWDQFVRSAKNGHFMFERNFMDYHAHRFEDHSLLFMRRGKLIGLMPAHWKRREDGSGGSSLCSHEGLPFSGIVSGARPAPSTRTIPYAFAVPKKRRPG